MMKKFGKNIASLFLSMDAFGSPLNIQVRKDPCFRTIPGSVVSLGILTFCFYSFASLIINLYNQTNPNVISNVEFAQDATPYVLTPDNFRISTIVTDMFGKPIVNTQEKTYYQIMVGRCRNELQLVNGSTTMSYSCDWEPLIPCISNYPNKLFKDIGILRQKNQFAFCINQTSWQQLPILMKGTSSSYNMSNIAIEIRACKNETDGPTCASADDITQILNNGFVELDYVDFVLNQAGQTPYKPIDRQQLIRFSYTQNQQYTEILLKHSYMQTTFSPLYYFGTVSENHVLQFESLSSNQNGAIINGTFVLINFFLSQQTITYNRTYQTILDILGNIGGLYSFLTVLFGTFMFPYSQLQMNRYLSDRLFTYESHNKKLDHQLSKVVPQTDTARKVNLVSRQLNDKHGLKALFKQKNKRLNLSCFEAITIFIYGEKHDLLKKSSEAITSKLDVLYILQKLIEIDKLKQILLEEHQQRLLEYLPKPQISIRKNSNDLIFNKYLSYEESVQRALEGFKHIVTNESSNLDKKLVEHMDEEVKSLFQQIVMGMDICTLKRKIKLGMIFECLDEFHREQWFWKKFRIELLQAVKRYAQQFQIGQKMSKVQYAISAISQSSWIIIDQGTIPNKLIKYLYDMNPIISHSLSVIKQNKQKSECKQPYF